jgi:hypothetical protein
MIKRIASLIIGTEVSDMKDALEWVYFDDGDFPFEFKIAKCKCGCDEFILQEDPDRDDNAVRGICCECDEILYICDSEKRWDNRMDMNMMCGCGCGGWNVGVVLSLYEEGGEVRRITIIARCCECQHIDYVCEWDIDYTPSRHLLDMA